ncbi:hypothetical protein CONCODRAFT_17227 [Conidiobolus coronatus NRRL 28638]|uniref:RNI-like protein n=1 Tax=Conidiobolus coronatus (strain ATCC 28846 / CBS 209.66 / NRRL 28638) TaxID=796925 RepID=A0A137P7N7_CONC2|nr:hypothetical protein CONCODRAFT_17227 [Conidiobolus coronatus NRRL 28638]|eukprot:KXN70954.1 hypothetical protein CONCODRAFT_17227 [Conidiobolus coronatus NRRL 28638]
MSKIDQKLIYNLLCSTDILKYLNICDKTELSSSCKYIYEKCSIIRLENFKFGLMELLEYNYITQKEHYWGHEKYKFKPEYFNTIINKHKDRLLCLTYSVRDYFIIEYFSLKFTNLKSLCLDYIILPKTTLKGIIKNLPNLRTLLLCGIIAGYSKNDIQVADFKFSKHLKELTWINCTQFELDSTDYLSINQHGFGSDFENENTLDLSLNSVNTLEYLDWQRLNDDNIQLFNETIFNNPRLTNLKADLICLNSNSFNLISRSPNLTKLTISMYGESVELDSSILCKLPNIKTLELYTTLENVLDSIDLLVSSCPNLEELKLPYYEEFEHNINDILKNFANLKILSINVYSVFPSTLGSILPESNLEKLEIYSIDPLKFDFNTFINMKKLKYINNTHKDYNYNEYDEISEYENLKGWRVISYPESTQYWKTK